MKRPRVLLKKKKLGDLLIFKLLEKKKSLLQLDDFADEFDDSKYISLIKEKLEKALDLMNSQLDNLSRREIREGDLEENYDLV